MYRSKLLAIDPEKKLQEMKLEKEHILWHYAIPFHVLASDPDPIVINFEPVSNIFKICYPIHV
uniref:Uncharacterized protein n=1 Tax=Romanomermis culicivorax TaxID=13658 RepID=A0A915JJZ6_ROMCU